jgi:hypothetical protein
MFFEKHEDYKVRELTAAQETKSFVKDVFVLTIFDD